MRHRNLQLHVDPSQVLRRHRQVRRRLREVEHQGLHLSKQLDGLCGAELLWRPSHEQVVVRWSGQLPDPDAHHLRQQPVFGRQQ